MYIYGEQDTVRRHIESAKGSQFEGADPDDRDAFARDRARVLHSAALRRLADKTQVVGPRDGDTPRTRLTHSLEVAQIARGIGSELGLNPDLCDMAGLTHDLGHPPYGHNGEVALDEVAHDCGGFEGNAQTIRILTRLEPKLIDASGHPFGLNLTRASLDAACKYPVTRTNEDGTVNRKYSAYDEDADILTWIRQGHTYDVPPMEAQVMDWSDDIAYSVHDVEDGIVSGRISLNVLWDLVELASLADKGSKAFGGSVDELLEAADSLRSLPTVRAAADFDHSLHGQVALKRLTSELVGRFVGATLTATVEHPDNQKGMGRQHGRLIIPPRVMAEVTLLKTIAVLYVMDQPLHQERQLRQRERIFRVFDFLMASAPGELDPMYRQWYEEADDDKQRHRVIIDQLASLTESRLERLDRRAAGLAGFMG